MPDSTSTISCSPNSLVVFSGTTTCTIIPKNSNSVIYSNYSYFSLSDGSDGQFTWDTMATPAATSFSFLYTAASSSSSVSINNGVSTTSVIVYGIL